MNEGELQADALTDLATKANALSMWLLENETCVDRAVTALAANRDVLANLDYVLLDTVYLTDLDIRIFESRGETPDEEVNTWHRDLIELSAQKIMALAGAIKGYGHIDRILEKRCALLIAQGIEAKNIDPMKVSAKILAKVR